MKIVEFLISAGWTRTPEWDGEECGWLGERGVCVKSARWRRRVQDRPLCAAHAKISIELTPEWELRMQREGRI